MTGGSVIAGVLAISALVGLAVISSVIFVYVRSQKVGQGGTLMMLGGIALFGLSAWQSFELTAGQLTLKAKSILSDVQVARALIQENVGVPAPSPASCERERAELVAALQIQLQQRKQLEEMLSNIEKVAADLSMVPIRNIR